MSSSSRSAARPITAASPAASAAATRSSRRVSGGSDCTRRRKLCSIRLGSSRASGRPKPPASSAGVSPRGSSSSASGLPRVSATIRSRTCASSPPGRTVSRSSRASYGASPSSTSSGRPSSSWRAFGSRTANSMAIGSAASRRATKDSTDRDSGSSHCTSSITQTSGCSSATYERRLSAARPTRKLAGAGPSVRPKARRSASRCGAGSCSARSSICPPRSCARPAKASSISDSTPPTRATRQADDRSAA